MKRVLTFIIAFVGVITLFAQAPEKMSYQAVIRNESNQLVTNTTIGMRISILQSSISGTAVFIETQKPKTNANGLVTIEIGAGSVVSGTFASIDWSKGPYFIKTETDPTGGINYTISGTSQLLSVPYAFFAKTAANGFSGNYNDLSNKPTIPTKVSQLTNDKGYLNSEKDSSVTNEIQSLTLRNDTIFLSRVRKDSSFVVLPKNTNTISPSNNSFFFDSRGGLTKANDSVIVKYSTGFNPLTGHYKDYSFLIPKDGVIKNLIATPTQNAVASGSTGIVRILINGKPTPLTVSFTNTDGFNVKSDTISSVNVKRGDFIAIQYKSKGIVVPGTFFQAIVELDANNSKYEFTHYVGELYGGGIVVSVWKDTSGLEHGLIASLNDLSSGIEWSNVYNDTIGLTARNSLDGTYNIAAILNQSGHSSSAAQLCDNYTIGGYSDWYLPSVIELNICSSVSYKINSILGNKSGFDVNSLYWSSTEATHFPSGISYGRVIHFGLSGGIATPKSWKNRVRAVRKF